jgi:uncharacterized protein YqgV (UPF0045/DUF77 family)
MDQIMISAQVSVYPLRQEHLSPAVEHVRQALTAHQLRIEVGPMSTYVTGSADALFAALKEAFTGAAEAGPTVMAITVSNACPI